MVVACTTAAPGAVVEQQQCVFASLIVLLFFFSLLGTSPFWYNSWKCFNLKHSRVCQQCGSYDVDLKRARHTHSIFSFFFFSIWLLEVCARPVQQLPYRKSTNCSLNIANNAAKKKRDCYAFHSVDSNDRAGWQQAGRQASKWVTCCAAMMICYRARNLSITTTTASAAAATTVMTLM